MKTIRFCFFLFAFCSFPSLFAQEKLDNDMLFPQFEEGIVFFKSGVQTSAPLNYNMLQQQMWFLDADSAVMKITNPLDISVVVIGERRFFPVSDKGVFYEEVPAGEGFFFVRRKVNLLSEGKPVPYGGYSQTSSATTYNSYRGSNGMSVSLKPDNKFRMETQHRYYLKSGNKYKLFYSVKTLGKLFKGHESEIKAFAERESIDFAQEGDIVRIVAYAYSLK